MASFSVTARQHPAVRRAIECIDSHAWMPIMNASAV